ncbi:L,D-transpeptidase [Stappia stellulata]|uniref:L,D-transpeptidase n=1 Tax=Stappia stellulata TaxID=71235 RepID=UPI00048B4D44|nr:L,D-transpeptidase [Stappia stellulata]
MRLFRLLAITVAAAVIATPTLAARYFDPATKQWIDYTAHGVPSGKSPIPRKRVRYDGPYKPGTVIIDTSERRLYHVLGNGRAMKYGIGVGREGFQWAGTQRISRKAEWPGWTPPPQMRARERRKGRILPAHMPGGPNNPLGARALYLGNTLYRIHGSNEPWTIGTAVSSGCIRMANDDVKHLYDKINIGAKVVVKR